MSIYFKNLDLLDVTEKHRRTVKKILKEYVLFCNGEISLEKTIEYLTVFKSKYDCATYAKAYFQIKKFLKFLDFGFVDKLPKAKVKTYMPKKITQEMFSETLARYKDDLQVQTLLMLGSVSGLRAEELYQLNPEDIDLENRVVHIKRDESHTTKNETSIRDAFFDTATQTVLKRYLDAFNAQFTHDKLFGMSTIKKKVRGNPIMIKDLRHVFARNATMRGMPSGVIKRILGHSLKQDILESNYNYMESSDLKKLYDKYFN